MQHQTALTTLSEELSNFEGVSVRAALRALAADAQFVEKTEELLDLESRLILVKRMAFSRLVHPHWMQQLETVVVKARELLSRCQSVRPRVAKVVDSIDRPPQSALSSEQLDESIHSARELQTLLAGIVDRWHLTAYTASDADKMEQA